MSQASLELHDDLDPERAIELAEARADLSERDKWPAKLLELADHLEAYLRRHGIADPRDHAEGLAISISLMMGGRPMYLPMGKAIERALRDRRIYRDIRAGNYDALAEREGICVQQVYKIVGEMRALESRRRQPGLFDAGPAQRGTEDAPGA